MDAETFACPNCSTDIMIEDARDTEAVTCSQCGNAYRVEYDDVGEKYELVPDEPVQLPMDIDTDRV